MQGYSVNCSVNIHDVDFNGVAKTSAILRYIQTAAQGQLNGVGMSYDELKERGRAFLLSRMKLEVLRPLRAYTPLVASSFACQSRGYSFLRCYTLESDGEIVARAISAWALTDISTRSLVRVGDFDLPVPINPLPDMSISHFKLPSALIDVGGYGVHYGDVDQNRHMNNTKYPDMYSSYLPLENKMIRSISINYATEAAMGERLRVQRAEMDGFYYFRTVRADGRINSEAEIELADIRSLH